MTQITLTPTKSYATKANAELAIAKYVPIDVLEGQTWFIMMGEDGRFFPVFIGMAAIHAGIFHRFNVVA